MTKNHLHKWSLLNQCFSHRSPLKKFLGAEDFSASFHQQNESAFGYKYLKTYYTRDKLKSHFRNWKMCTKISQTFMFFNWGIQQQYEKSLELFQEILYAVAFLQYFLPFEWKCQSDSCLKIIKTLKIIGNKFSILEMTNTKH